MSMAKAKEAAADRDSMTTKELIYETAEDPGSGPIALLVSTVINCMILFSGDGSKQVTSFNAACEGLQSSEKKAELNILNGEQPVEQIELLALYYDAANSMVDVEEILHDLVEDEENFPDGPAGREAPDI